jgi:penicillin-binding protein 1A
MFRASRQTDPDTPLPRAPLPRRARSGRVRWRLLQWGVLLTVWASLTLFVGLLYFSWDLPRPETALDAARRPSLTLEDTAGQVFATFGDVVGDPLRLSDMPAYLPAAAVAVEDRRFYRHWGLDVLGVARAVLVNLRSGHFRQGGSTITQQVAKNLFLSNAKTLRRKVQELLLTLWLEHSFTKQEILEIWLNRVYLGSGAFGVDAAAKLYFGISARHVSLWQAAVLAGLPQAPSRLSPRVNPDGAAARGREVLAAMAEMGAITPEQARAASARIVFPPRRGTGGGWFADWVADQGQTLIEPNADAVLHTTLDQRLQATVETHLDALLDGPGRAADVGQGAVVALDAATGEVRAMVGGRDYRTSPYNRAVSARRQPGSAFKPFVWLAALEKGSKPDDLVLDGPLRIGGYSPANFDGRFRGEVTLEDALASSLNTASVRLLLQVGGPRVVAETAHRLGISDTLPDNASLALGTGEVGLLELTAAYAPLANGGMRVMPIGLTAIESGGRSVPLFRTAPVRVIDPETAAGMARMLRAVVVRGSGRAAGATGRVVSGKTGTTQEGRDGWFVGWTGGLVIGVWLGNDDGHPATDLTGGGLPARLVAEIAATLGE